jgi:hypothetical protein
MIQRVINKVLNITHAIIVTLTVLLIIASLLILNETNNSIERMNNMIHNEEIIE